MTYNPPPGSDPFNQPPSDPFGQSGTGTPNPYAQQPVSPPPPPPISPPPPPPMAPQYGQPYGQQPPQYGYPQAAAAPKTNGMGIASMVLGIVGVLLCWCYGIGALPGLVGAILGHISLKQIKQRNEGGRGMALTGIITGWLAVFLVIVGVVIVAIAIANDPNFWDELNRATDSD